VLADRDRLFDEVPKVLWDGRCQSARFEDTQYFVPSDKTHLGNTMRVTESDTDLRRGQTLAGKLDDVLDDIIWGSFEPGGRGAAVREGGGRNALSGSVHTTHGD